MAFTPPVRHFKAPDPSNLRPREVKKRQTNHELPFLQNEIPKLVQMIKEGGYTNAIVVSSNALRTIQENNFRVPDLKATFLVCRARARVGLEQYPLMEADLILASYLEIQDPELKAEIARDLACHYSEEGRYDEAYKHLINVACLQGLHPNLKAQIYYNLGLIYEKSNRQAERDLAFKTARDANPDDPMLISLIQEKLNVSLS